MHGEQFYIIGFSSDKMARRVQYNLHPSPYIHLKKNNKIELDIMKKKISIDPCGELRVQKYIGSPSDPLNDGNYHISIYYDSEFLMYPYKKMVGLIIPYEITDETDTEFNLLSTVIDPFFDPDLYKSSIDNKL